MDCYRMLKDSAILTKAVHVCTRHPRRINPWHKSHKRARSAECHHSPQHRKWGCTLSYVSCSFTALATVARYDPEANAAPSNVTSPQLPKWGNQNPSLLQTLEQTPRKNRNYHNLLGQKAQGLPQSGRKSDTARSPRTGCAPQTPGGSVTGSCGGCGRTRLTERRRGSRATPGWLQTSRHRHIPPRGSRAAREPKPALRGSRPAGPHPQPPAPRRLPRPPHSPSPPRSCPGPCPGPLPASRYPRPRSCRAEPQAPAQPRSPPHRSVPRPGPAYPGHRPGHPPHTPPVTRLPPVTSPRCPRPPPRHRPLPPPPAARPARRPAGAAHRVGVQALARLDLRCQRHRVVQQHLAGRRLLHEGHPGAGSGSPAPPTCFPGQLPARTPLSTRQRRDAAAGP